MIKLRDFLEVANSPVTIKDGIHNVMTISDDYFDFNYNILSEKLLDSEVSIVEADSKCFTVALEGGI